MEEYRNGTGNGRAAKGVWQEPPARAQSKLADTVLWRGTRCTCPLLLPPPPPAPAAGAKLDFVEEAGRQLQYSMRGREMRAAGLAIRPPLCACTTHQDVPCV